MIDLARGVRDRELVQASLSGDRIAVRGLAKRLECVPRILAALNHKMSAPFGEADLADLSQDVLILIWKRRERFEGRAQIETWAYRFCYLEFMNCLRKTGRRKTLPLEVIPEVRDPAIGREQDRWDVEDLERKLQDLGPPEEDILRLKHFEDLTFREIGERLGMPTNSAKTRYYRGIDWLRTRLSAGNDEVSP